LTIKEEFFGAKVCSEDSLVSLETEFILSIKIHLGKQKDLVALK